MSGSEVRLEDGRLSFRLGREASIAQELRAAEAEHRREIEDLKGQLATVAAATRTTPATSDTMIQQVQSIVRESEERQAQRFEASLRDLSVRSETQRRYDLARVSAGLSYLDGKTGQHVARTTELMGYVLQAAEKK